MKLQHQGQIGKIQTLSDGGYKYDVFTPDLPIDKGVALLQLRNLAVNILIASEDEAISSSEISEKIDPTIAKHKDKSKSKLLRNVIYRIWEQNGSHGDPDEYYERVMDKIIAAYKEKLND